MIKITHARSSERVYIELDKDTAEFNLVRFGATEFCLKLGYDNYADVNDGIIHITYNCVMLRSFVVYGYTMFIVEDMN